MTTKEIMKALDGGRRVTLKGNPKSIVCKDCFGGLVVVSLRADEPIRLATLADKRKAVINP